MRISVQHSDARCVEQDLPQLLAAARSELGGHNPQLIVCSSTEQHLGKLPQLLHDLAPHAAIHGASSCRGVLTADGHVSNEMHAVGIFTLYDELGAYGSASEAFQGDPALAARNAARRALQAADRIGEIPELVWLSSSPGNEEQVLSGLQSEFGTEVPIMGGSAADNSVAGNWAVFDNNPAAHSEGVTVTVMFPSTPLATAFHSGYEPTEQSWLVTAATGRDLHQLDDQEAATVYDQATQGLVSRSESNSDESLLQLSTFQPLGRIDSYIGDIPMYLLSHPAASSADGSLGLFSEVHEGDRLTLMTASNESLLERPSRVVQSALSHAGWDTQDVAACLLIFCGGCMLAVENEIDLVAQRLAQTLPGVPFLGNFTFGEQGRFLEGKNRHGNLMISCVLFRKTNP